MTKPALANDDAVADTLGSILMVAITVLAAGALGLMLLSFKGPVPLLHAQVAVSVDPGAGGWGTGDESVRVANNGGDRMDAQQATFIVTIGGTTTRFTGAAQLGSAFCSPTCAADGYLTIGETWTHAYNIASGAAVTLAVATNGDPSQLVATSALIAAAVSTSPTCATDMQAPSVIQWTQTPGTLTALTTGSVTITAQVTDNCWGVNPGVIPDLFWRLNSGSNPPYTDQGPMASAGTNTWRASVPAQSWSSFVGARLEYYVGTLQDLGTNAGNSDVASSTILSDCSADNVPPTLSSVVQSPNDVKTSTTGAVTVTAVATDNCSGVDQANAPHLLYRFNDGSNPAFVDSGAMTLTATSTWRGTVPAQTWALLVGKVLEYQVQNLRDLNLNLGSSVVYQDTVDGVFTYTYVAANTPTKGTVSAFTNACCSAAAGTDGADASIAEAGTPGTPLTVLQNANAATAATGWTAGGNGFASDNAYSTFATSSPLARSSLTGAYNNDLVYDLQDPVAGSGTITQVVVHAEVSITSYNNDGFKIYACFASTITCDALSAVGGQSATDTNLDYDITSLRPGGGTWSWSDISNLQVALNLVQSGAKDGTWRVDYVYATVTSASTTYATDVQLDWTGVATGLSPTLDLKYRVTGDTFVLQVYDWTLSSYGTRTPSPAFTASSATTYSTPLSVGEVGTGANVGKVRIRITDANAAGTVQGTFYFDYARVSTL